MQLPTRTLTAFALLIASGMGCAQTIPPEQPIFRNGGVGYESQQEMKTLRSQYRLWITFAEQGTGAYLAGVTMSIDEVNGRNRLRFQDCGPLFFVAPDPGVYRISATHGGITQTRVVDLRHGARELVFYWPAA